MSPLLAGTAHPTLTAGTPGKVDVTYVGTPVDLGGSAGTSVPVIVWNGTKGTVTHLDVSGPATDSSGSVIGSGDSQDIEPQNLTPGQVAFGMVFFEQSVPTGSKFNFTVSYDQGPSTYFLDAQVTQANFENDQFGDGTITGSVVNNGTASMHGPISSDAFCFDGSGTITSVFPGFISGNGGLAPGQTGSYSISLFEDVDCSTYLVGASGFGSL